MGKVVKKVFKAVAVVASIGAAVVTGGLSLGISAGLLSGIAMGATLAGSLLGGRKLPKASPANQDRLNASINPNAPRTMVFGRTAMATDIRDQEFTGADQEYLHRFIVVAAHKVQAIEEIWFDDQLAWTVGGGVQGDFVGYLTVAPILEGSAANAINISARMGSARRYTGCAYIHFRHKLTGNSKKTESPFAQSVPTRLTIIGKGIPVYDPRLDSTVPGGSGSHRANDQSTWTWDDNACRNPALQSLTYWLGWRINGELSVGKGIPASRIDLQSFITAANICDEPIALAAGGTQPAYRSDCVVSEADDLQVVLSQFEAVMDGRFHDPQGRIALKCMVYDHATPTAQFTQHDVLGAVEWQPYGPLDEKYNIIRGRYTDASQASLYQLVDIPEVKVASDDGIDRILSIDLPAVQSPEQAQRLLMRRLKRAKYGGTFTAELQATAWRCSQFDPVRMTFPKLGLSNSMMRVEEIETRVDGIVPVLLSIEAPEIYDWDADELPAIVPVYPTQYTPTNSPAAVALNGMEDGINITDGTIKAGKVTTASIVSGAVNASASVSSSGTFNHTAWTVRGSTTFTPFSAASHLVINISAGVIIGDASAGGTFAEWRLTRNGTVIWGPYLISNQRAALIGGSNAIRQSGLTGAQTYNLEFMASATHGAGDPHLVDLASIAIFEGKTG